MTTVKAAFHAHSDWSYDGRLPLPEVSRLFAAAGYDVAFMCEHDVGFTPDRKRAYDEACAEASATGALLVPGIEYGDAANRVHVPVWGPVPFLGEEQPTLRVLQAARDSGGAAVIAHPVRREAWRSITPACLELCAGIEIWTRKWDGWAPNPWAVKQAAAYGLVGAVSLDLHRASQMFPLAMELQLEGSATTETCLGALAAGRSRALVCGMPVAPLTRGAVNIALQRMERAVRRPVWRQGRRIRDRLAASR
ncbi:MAG: PHP domain-containing protein [Solirubrobacteraceae bacterium]